MLQTLIDGWPLSLRIAAFIGVAVGTHLVVLVLRRLSAVLLSRGSDREYRKLRSIGTLMTSVAIFSLYFLAVGLILRELGVSLTAYLASASVLGLAVGFGSQGLVQDVVTGLTLIFSDLLDVGDLVEVSGQTGVVRGISMRFVELQNAMGASVFIPNRSITNIINYPRGYVRCLVDVTLRGTAQERDAAADKSLALMRGAQEQFPGILLTEPSSEGRRVLSSGREIIRIKFRIWPGRGQPIESSFVQELAAELQVHDPDYRPWMIAVTYEVEKPGLRPRVGLWPLKQRR